MPELKDPGVTIWENLTSQVDGARAVFATYQVIQIGTSKLWKNGVYQGLPGQHFSEDLDRRKSVTLEEIPIVGDEIHIEYRIGYLPY